MVLQAERAASATSVGTRGVTRRDETRGLRLGRAERGSTVTAKPCGPRLAMNMDCAIQKGKPMHPTQQIYDELQSAYDHFNKELFDDALPDCLITLQRERRTFGYYCRDRFVNHGGTITDEIAMNPAYFGIRSIRKSLSTLVHEMQASMANPFWQTR